MVDDHVAQQTPKIGSIAFSATLGLLSAAFGFAAEATKPQLAEVLHLALGVEGLDGRCIYPSSITLRGLGATALLVLLLSRVYCPGYCPPTRSSYSIAQLSRLLYWIAWLGAICFYIAGLIMMSDQGELEQSDDPLSYIECKVVKPGIFGAGASFSLASIILEIIYYLVVAFDRRLAESHKTTTELNLAI